MKVSKRNVPSFYDKNINFNHAAYGLVQSIFQHHEVGTIGYIDVRTSSPNGTPVRMKNHVEDGDGDLNGGGPNHERFDLRNVGEYERRILSALVSGKYPTLVLIGDMGSGKTATINHLIEVFRRPRLKSCGVCQHCNPVVIKLNFNVGFADDDTAVLRRTFRRVLYDQLCGELHHLFEQHSLTDALLDEVRKRGDDGLYSSFGRFARKHRDSEEWNSMTDDVKADALFAYLDEVTRNGTEFIHPLMALVHLTKRRLNSDPACLILIFDNIDSVKAEAQFEILAEILSYQEAAQAQMLVTLRRANFQKFEHNSGAHTFGTLDHIGPDIKEIIEKRLSYYAQSWDTLPEVAGMSASYRQALKNRLSYLLARKNDQRGALHRVASLSGSSIRHGLFLCERLMINSAVAYDKTPANRDDIVRAVLVGNQRSNEISANDLLIVNLLLNKVTDAASLLNVRILQLVAEFGDDASNRVSTLVDMLKAIGGWSEEEIIEALNYLLHMKRPLLWVDGKTRYDKEVLARHGDDVMTLTEAGHYYLREMLLDLVYVQEAALSVKWLEGHIPNSVDYARVVERFEVLRCFLTDLAGQDYEQTVKLKEWLADKGKVLSVEPILIINRTMASLGKSALYILLSRINPQNGEVDAETMLETVGELKNWRSMINIWIGNEREVTRTAANKLGRANKRLEQLSVEYKDKLEPLVKQE